MLLFNFLFPFVLVFFLAPRLPDYDPLIVTLCKHTILPRGRLVLQDVRQYGYQLPWNEYMSVGE